MYLKTKDKFQFMQDFRNAVEQCMSDSPDNLSLSEIVLDVIAQRHNQRYGNYASLM
jgi:urease accessory protein UreF